MSEGRRAMLDSEALEVVCGGYGVGRRMMCCVDPSFQLAGGPNQIQVRFGLRPLDEQRAPMSTPGYDV